MRCNKFAVLCMFLVGLILIYSPTKMSKNMGNFYKIARNLLKHTKNALFYCKICQKQILSLQLIAQKDKHLHRKI